MKQCVFACMLIFGVTSCKTETSKSIKKEIKMEVSNKEKAVAVLSSLETGDQNAIGYINPEKYIQHNLAVGDGLAGFGEVMKHAPPQGFKANVVRSFEDGNYVFTNIMHVVI